MPFILYYILTTIKMKYKYFEDWLLCTWGDFYHPLMGMDDAGTLRYVLQLSRTKPEYVPDTREDIEVLWLKLYEEYPLSYVT